MLKTCTILKRLPGSWNCPPRQWPLWLICLWAGLGTLQAQSPVTVDTTVKPEALVRALVGPRVEVFNVSFGGSSRSLGIIRDSSERPLVQEGVILATGFASRAVGPNRSASMGVNMGGVGDNALSKIGKFNTFDATYLRFDFVAEMEEIEFNFIFASEEYLEYVGTQFNDVFAFYIRKPGISTIRNLAVLPDGKTPITVNSVNHNQNRDHFQENDYFDRRGKPLESKASKLSWDLLNNYEYDGFTKLLKASTHVTPGDTYQIKIAIADVGDPNYDSAVILEAGSFRSMPSEPVRRAEIELAEASLAPRRRFQPAALGEDPVPVVVAPPAHQKPPSDAGQKPPSGTTSPPEHPSGTGSPTVPAPPAAALKPIVIEFAFDSDRVRQQEREALDSLATFLETHPSYTLKLDGHTDGRGSDAYNMGLSRRREQAVRAYLLDRGLLESRMEGSHHGYHEPVASNATDEGRQRNRRVSLQLVPH